MSTNNKKNRKRLIIEAKKKHGQTLKRQYWKPRTIGSKNDQKGDDWTKSIY